MAKLMFMDLETRSRCELKEAGLYQYAADDSTEILVVSVAFDNEPVRSAWLPAPSNEDAALLDRMDKHIREGRTVVAHNASFERLLWLYQTTMSPIQAEQMVCTAVKAAAMGLPRSLEKACPALGLAHVKDTEGARLMRKISKPGRNGFFHSDEKDFARLTEYCERDVEATRNLYLNTFALPPEEHRAYVLDQEINDRGFQVDRPLVVKLAEICERAETKANVRIRDVTEDEVKGVSDVHGLRRWLGMDSVAKAALEERLASTPREDWKAREVIEARLDSGKSSTKKLAKLASYSEGDARVRGTLLFHGAATGRWSGRGPQPQNLPRGEIKDAVDWIPAIMADSDSDPKMPKPIPLASSLLRSCIVAYDDWKLIGCDLSQIEARVLAWLAGQRDVVSVFARGEDVYRYAAAKLFRKEPEEVTDDERFRGKVTVLACGYQVGSKTFQRQMKAMYNVDITTDEAVELVEGYRRENDHVVDLWAKLDKMAVAAVTKPDRVWDVSDGRVSAEMVNGHLRLRLPSGRHLTYVHAAAEEETTPWGTSMGVTYTGKPRHGFATGRIRMYGGRWAENVVQAIARDVMLAGMFRLEAEGFKPILTVHDEIVCEVESDKVDLAAVEAAMTADLPWAPGLPVAAEGWVGERYRK